MVITPDSCWPFDFAIDFKPSSVTIATAHVVIGDGSVDKTVCSSALSVDWEYINSAKGGRIVIKNIPGLSTGKHRITLRIEK